MDSSASLQLIIYLILMISLIAYATLDGFDLGVGCLHLFAKKDLERRIQINAIGPVWDGNATWIVIGGGVLLSGFPKAFAILTSALYTPIMLLLFGFMLRGAAVEFRNKGYGNRWRSLWDVCFFLASLLLAITFGLLIGNLIQGLPLTQEGAIQGELLALLHPYPILVALFGISLFMMHGAIYLLMKTEGSFHNRIRGWANRLIRIFFAFWVATTAVTFLFYPHMIRPFSAYPYLAIFPFLNCASILAIPLFVAKKRDGWAFISSCLSIFLFLTLFVIGTFPNIAYSTIDPERASLTLYNASASKLALTILLIVACSSLPLAYFYISYVYRVFKGKVKIDPMSY